MMADGESGKATRRYRAPWHLGFPALLPVLIGFGLVAAWLYQNPPPAESRVVAQTRVRFAGDVAEVGALRKSMLLFMLPPLAAVDRADEVVSREDLRPLEAHPRPLTYADFPHRARLTETNQTNVRAQAARLMLGYRPTWAALNPFGPTAAYGLGYIIEMSPALSAGGFTIPGAMLQSLDGGDQPWDLTVSIACGEDGRPHDIFALNDSALSGVQSNIVRMLHSGNGYPGTMCEGRLTVRWAHIPLAGAHGEAPGKESAWPSES